LVVLAGGGIIHRDHDPPRPMTAHTWPGAELACAQSIQRAVHRQARTSALVGALAVAWRLGPLPAPEPLLGYVVFGVAVTLVVELLVGAMQRDRADRCADELIERGFAAAGRSDAVSRAVQARAGKVVSEPNRRRIANALRWQLELEAAPAPTVRARNAALMLPSGFTAHADRVGHIADAIERGPCDPRAVIRVGRLLSAPAAAGSAESDAVGAALRAVEDVLGESTQLRSGTASGANSGPRRDYRGPRSTSVFRETGRRF
jgi:hypothetical protein